MAFLSGAAVQLYCSVSRRTAEVDRGAYACIMLHNASPNEVTLKQTVLIG